MNYFPPKNLSYDRCDRFDALTRHPHIALSKEEELVNKVLEDFLEWQESAKAYLVTKSLDHFSTIIPTLSFDGNRSKFSRW